MDEREALLATLRDPYPPDVGWWPLAPGWWIVIALGAIAVAALVTLLVALLRGRARIRRADAWRRDARAELDSLRTRSLAGDSPGALLAEASVLARRTLLAVEPRAAVAPLHGEAWLRALDAASGGDCFTRGGARLLASAPFERAPTLTRDDLGDVFDALESVIMRAARSGAVEGAGRGVVAPVTGSVG